MNKLDIIVIFIDMIFVLDKLNDLFNILRIFFFLLDTMNRNYLFFLENVFFMVNGMKFLFYNRVLKVF